MNHFKLVALAESPTRYTKVIRVPGADTKYNRRYEATGYVSRYTKSVAPPASYVPPGPDFEPLELVSAPVLTGIPYTTNTLTGTQAVYSGGQPPVVVQSQIQRADSATGPWSGVDAWGTEAQGTHYIGQGDLGKYFRTAGRAIDESVNSVAQANTLMSFSNVIGPVTEKPAIGDITATVDGSSYDLVAAPALTILTLAPIPVAVQKSGTVDVTYSWSVRGDVAAEFSNPIGASTDVTIATAGVATVTCIIQSMDETKRADIQFVAITAEKWDTINLYCHEAPTFSATDGCNAGSVLSVTSFGDTLPTSVHERYFWEACGAGKDQSVENNWSSRSSDADYVVDNYDFNHGFSFRLSVKNVAAEPLSTGYEKIIYCNSSVMQFDEN